MLNSAIITTALYFFVLQVAWVTQPLNIKESDFPYDDKTAHYRTFFMDGYCPLYLLWQCPTHAQSILPLEKSCDATKFFCCNTTVPPHIQITCPTCKRSLHFPRDVPFEIWTSLVSNKNCNHRKYRDNPKAYQKLTMTDHKELQKYHQLNNKLYPQFKTLHQRIKSQKNNYQKPYR